MLGKLTNDQIDNVLYAQTVGRIGCYADEKVYFVPVTYAYHNDYLYAHSKEGMKVALMRKYRNVCFQVDIVENMANWRSVVLWGEYEELRSEQEQEAGLKILMDKLTPMLSSETVRPSPGKSRPPEVVEKGFKAVAYRIRVTEKTGRYEKSSY
jgi:nitroimidazol reductase NimA-like FMN-containing flavoprotein (pyridoxamine 5'-phosphate oxidase superfamily)